MIRDPSLFLRSVLYFCCQKYQKHSRDKNSLWTKFNIFSVFHPAQTVLRYAIQASLRLKIFVCICSGRHLKLIQQILDHLLHSLPVTRGIFVETVEPFTAEALEKCRSWLSKSCEEINRPTDTHTESALWIFLHYFVQKFFLFSISVCCKDDAVLW